MRFSTFARRAGSSTHDKEQFLFGRQKTAAQHIPARPRSEGNYLFAFFQKVFDDFYTV